MKIPNVEFGGRTEALKSMDCTTVEIVSDELLNTNEAAMRVRVKTPADDGMDNRAGGLLLRRYNKHWRVRTNL